jgi:alkanesulfonate monooxygenase SsuD/methylene tetrahydromethanopterin reductase-like flavin-dependent oxidoreductase (luciferase family)
VVDFCDGWLPIGRDQKTVLDGIADLERRAAEKGRPMSSISISVFGAPPKDEALEAYERAGVGRVLLRLPSEGRDTILPLLDRYAGLVEARAVR